MDASKRRLAAARVFAAFAGFIVFLAGIDVGNAAAPAQTYGQVAVTIVIPKRNVPVPAGNARARPLYVSFATQSIQVLTDGANPIDVDTFTCGTSCALHFQVSAGPHIFTVKTFDQTGEQGNVLSLNSVGPIFVKAHGSTLIRLALEGVVQNIELGFAQPIVTPGREAQIPLSVNLEDADHGLIIGPAQFANAPITLTTSDPVNGALSRTKLTSPADAQGITISYSGAKVGSITFSARAANATGLLTPAVLFTQPVPSAHRLYATSYPGDYSRVAAFSTLGNNPFLGSIGSVDPDLVNTGVAVDSAAGKLYVAGTFTSFFGKGTVAVYSTGGGYPLLANLSGIGSASAIAVDPITAKLFVLTNHGSAKVIDVYSTASGYHRINTIGVQDTGGAETLAVDPVAGKLYFGAQSVIVFSTRGNNARLATFGPNLNGSSPIAIDSSTGSLFLRRGNFILIYDTTHGYTLVGRFSDTLTTDFLNPTAIAFDPVRRELYLAESSGGLPLASTVKVYGIVPGFPLERQFLTASYPTSFALAP